MSGKLYGGKTVTLDTRLNVVYENWNCLLSHFRRFRRFSYRVRKSAGPKRSPGTFYHVPATGKAGFFYSEYILPRSAGAYLSIVRLSAIRNSAGQPHGGCDQE